MPTDDAQVRLNRLAQSMDDMRSGEDWFRRHDALRAKEILRTLGANIQQAGAVQSDVAEAIGRARLKESHTPCVLLSKGPLKVQLAKVLALPATEHLKVFRLLIALLGIADDRRRRERCAGGCDHWWHNLDMTE